MKQINCLLFDLDGTLLDSRDSVIDALYDTSAHFLPGRYTRYDLLGRFGESFDDFMREVEVLLPADPPRISFCKPILHISGSIMMIKCDCFQQI